MLSGYIPDGVAAAPETARVDDQVAQKPADQEDGEPDAEYVERPVVERVLDLALVSQRHVVHPVL